MTSKWFDYFHSFASPSYSLDEIRRSKFAEYFEHLQQNLDKDAADIGLSRKINAILALTFEHENLGQFLQELIDLTPDFGFISRRLMVVKDTEHPEHPEQVIFAESKETEADYRYLDGQVADLLINDEKIFINDTSRIRTLKFQPEMQIPKSVLAVRLDKGQKKIGILWFASPHLTSMTKDEAEALISIKEAISISVGNAVELAGLREQKRLDAQDFERCPIPFFVLTNGRIEQANQLTAAILNSLNQEDKGQFGSHIHSAIEKKERHLRVGESSFEVFGIARGAGAGNDSWSVFLLDEKQSALQRKYLENVMRAISLNLEKPLNDILGFIQMIPLLGEMNQAQKDYLDRIEKEVDRCRIYSRDLLDLSRVNQPNPLILSEHSVNEIVKSFLDATRHLTRQKRIQIENKIQDSSQVVLVDLTLFNQAIYLVLEYILDHLTPGKTVAISMGSQKDQWQLIFSDNGSGYTDFELSLINEVDPDPAVDMRMRLANGIMQFHGGVLTVESEVNRGSRYVFSWPQS